MVGRRCDVCAAIWNGCAIAVRRVVAGADTILPLSTAQTLGSAHANTSCHRCPVPITALKCSPYLRSMPLCCVHVCTCVFMPPG
jgi:hypothetical protein